MLMSLALAAGMTANMLEAKRKAKKTAKNTDFRFLLSLFGIKLFIVKLISPIGLLVLWAALCNDCVYNILVNT